MEEYFRSEESFMANINSKLFPCNRVFTLILFYPLFRCLLILGKLFTDIRANVTITFLHEISYQIISAKKVSFFTFMASENFSPLILQNVLFNTLFDIPLISLIDEDQNVLRFDA